MDATVARAVFHSSSAGLGTRRALIRRRLNLSSIPNPSRNTSLSPHTNPRYAATSASIKSTAPTAVLSRNGVCFFRRGPFSFPSHYSTPLNGPSSHSAGFAGSYVPDGKEGYLVWDRYGNVVSEGGDSGYPGEKGGVVWTAVLLGWLGAEHKQLRRYADLYRSRGIRVVSFVVPPWQLVSFDLGKSVERRVSAFARDIASWVSDSEKDGKEPCLLFHTFSNTGWIAYGAVLDNLQSGGGDIIGKIKGCVVDSGADPDINPQVWAAGFCAAFLKRRSSLTNSNADTSKGEKPDGYVIKLNHQIVTPYSELILLAVLEKVFVFVLGLPDVRQRLTKLISTLSKNQPDCPQLYLYSSADKVIPFTSVENFIQEQKSSGKTVRALNFGTSPHVDHLRSFPSVYSAEIVKFLEECAPTSVCAGGK